MVSKSNDNSWLFKSKKLYMEAWPAPQAEGQKVITYSFDAQFTRGGGMSKA